jgi:hypothetical protein
MADFFRQPAHRRLLLHAAVVVGLVFAAYIFFVSAAQKGSLAIDAAAYWRVNLADPYQGRLGLDVGYFFAYSPPIGALFAVLGTLPWLAFICLWYGTLLGAVAWLGRGAALAVLAFPPVAIDLYHGNIHLLLAVAIALGMARYPAAWAFVLLTKVTPGIGLLWFVVRREWRSLLIALGATAAIALASAVFLPSQWLSWLEMLRDNAGPLPPWPALPIPLWLRLPVAAAIIVWGARRDARWTVPLGAALAVPALWPGAFAILAACWPLRRSPAAAQPVTTPSIRELDAQPAAA